MNHDPPKTLLSLDKNGVVVVMEINKEREAFEEHLAGMNIHNLRVGTIFDIEKNEYFASDVLHPSEDHIVGWINFSWKLWQEKATPKGFVLVPKKLSDELNDHLWDFMTDNFISTNEDGDSYIACDDFDLGKFYSEIIEAQEQSHD
ncbi:hypothetical protein [Acinetobacter guillouiae]|uniref:hypothetical protein n=1 Tax=Acinetobacter guillouiae TaxID=106649 RepID=UPI0028E5CDBB|nr:hypothetical protein [Acinetobacter guillouiae]